jgi:uncharacterized surface protein with fasciclin (FAS1) repeats
VVACAVNDRTDEAMSVDRGGRSDDPRGSSIRAEDANTALRGVRPNLEGNLTMGIAHRYARLGRTVLATGAVLLAIGLTACSSTTSQRSTSSASVGASAVVSPEAGMMSAPAGTIIDIASGTPDLSTLVTAVNAAGLVDTLNGAGPYTVFAPTDEAFAALPAGVLDALLMPENKDTLAKILTYHVVPGKVMAADVTDGSIATVEGQPVTLSTSNGVTVDGATVVTPDIEASNGVIHVIDAVILPPDVDISSLSAA